MIGTRWQNYYIYPRPPKFLSTNACIFKILIVFLQKDSATNYIYVLEQKLTNNNTTN